MRILLLLLGVVCCSTSALCFKASSLDPTVLSAYRLLLAALVLSPLFFAKWRENRSQFSWCQIKRTLLPALAMALHFSSYVQGARWTEAANATLIINLGPIVMPFLLFYLVREKVSTGEITGTMVAMVGVCFLTFANLSLNPHNLLGDITCFVSMLLSVAYIVLGRGNRDLPSIWLYVVPLYAMAGLFCLLISCFVAHPFQPQPLREYGIALWLAVVPTAIGHSIFNNAIQHLRGQLVAIFNLFQFIGTSAFAYLLYHTTPPTIFYPAAAIIIGGVLIVLRVTHISFSPRLNQSATA